MKITRDLEKDQYIEWDFYDWLSKNGYIHHEMRLEEALLHYYFKHSGESSLSDFCKCNPAFSLARMCDTILEVNWCFYLIPDEMVDNDSKEAVNFFENLAEKIIKDS